MKILTGLILTLALILITSTAFADVLVKQVTVTEPMEMMGNKMPGSTDTSQVWFGEDRMFLSSSESTSLIRYDLGMMYILMPNKKAYSEVPLSMFDLSDAAAPDKPMVTASVSAVDESKKINGWNCTKYLVKLQMKMGMEGTQEMWVTKDVDVDFHGMMKAASGMMAGFTGFAEMMKEFEKIKGFPVHSTMKMNIMGATMVSVTEVISVEKKSAPAGTYEIPKGYTKIDPTEISPH